MASEKKITIIIPVYNVQEYIIKCLESVAEQSYTKSVECIIIDDCGNDESISLAKKFVENYQGEIEFKIIHHEHNRGLAAARNTGVAVSKGEFLLHLDSDDWLDNKSIELLLRKQEEANSDIVSGAAIRHRPDGDDILSEPNYKSTSDMVKKTIELTLDHVMWRRLIRKNLYTEHNISAVEGINIGEDHHTLPRLAYYAKSIAKIDDIVYHYNCLNPNSYMSKKEKGFNMKRFKNDINSIEILQNFFKDKDDVCTKRLIEIRKDYINDSLLNCCRLRDRESFKTITESYSISKYYWTCKLNCYYISLKLRIKRLIG